MELFEILEPQPLGCEPSGECLCPRILHQAADLLFEHHGIFQPALRRNREELLVGRAAP